MTALKVPRAGRLTGRVAATLFNAVFNVALKRVSVGASMRREELRLQGG